MGNTCVHCDCEVGDGAKVQPTTMEDGEVWCPGCFVGVRMCREPGRFNAFMTARVMCQFCRYETVSFMVKTGVSIRCSHCGRTGCLKMPPKINAADLDRMVRATS